MVLPPDQACSAETHAGDAHAPGRDRIRARSVFDQCLLASANAARHAARTARGLIAFALIAIGVLISRWRVARSVIGPLLKREITHGGIQLLPLFGFLAFALGFVVIGQAVSWLSRFGAIEYLGTIMVVVVVRELGPLLTAMVVLGRVVAATVVQLGTARALGEVEALESMAIDPVHYLVVPRLLGMALNVFALTVYLVLGVILSGYLWAFFQDLPLGPAEYFGQLFRALGWLDFVVLGLKTMVFGAVLAVVSCYHGLARPLQLEQVPTATVRAVGQSIVGCLVADALFLLVYLV